MQERSFREATRRNLGAASVLTSIAFVGVLPLDVITLFTPASVDEKIDDVLGLVFLCSPLLFLVALAVPAVLGPREPATRSSPAALIPAWILAIATVCVALALATPVVYAAPFVRRTDMAGALGSLVTTGWVTFTCFAGGLILAVVIVTRCIARVGHAPSADLRVRRRAATRAVTALVPLAATTVAVALALAGDAGWRFRTATEEGDGSPPEAWAFAASPVFGTAVFVGFAVTAVLLIGALIVFHSPPVRGLAPSEEALQS